MISKLKQSGILTFHDLLRYNVDEIEEKPKTVFSALCNRWLSITGVRHL